MGKHACVRVLLVYLTTYTGICSDDVSGQVVVKFETERRLERYLGFLGVGLASIYSAPELSQRASLVC